MKKNKILVIIIIIILSFSLVSCGNEKLEGGTNTQESSVDEGDIVKIGNDGLIYNSQSDGITVTQTDCGIMNVIATYSKKKYIPQEMFISGNYLITIGGIATAFNAGELAAFNYYNTSYSEIIVNIFDMESIKAMSFGDEKVSLNDYIKYSFSLNGQYYTSRLYSETKELYVIFCYSNYINRIIKNDLKPNNFEYNKTNITYLENGEEKQFSDIEEIKDLAEEHYNLDATLFIKINLNDDNPTATTKGYYGAKFQDLYMSETALFPIFLMYAYENKRAMCGKMKIPYSYMLKVSRENLQSQYQIKLANYTIYDRYAIKDFVDCIFVCATNRFNASVVFAYDSNLNEIGKLENIAPGEEIKSVTYQVNNDMRYCYITTFRQTDPLFKIDITTPTDIKLLSALKITGYATYLQTLSDRYMIGIGYDGNENNADNSIIKVSLYDVADNEIKLVNFITISCVTNSEALLNEKAIAIDKENMVFGFSVLREFNGKYIQGYYIFNVGDEELNDLAYVTNFENVFNYEDSVYDAFRRYIARAFVYEGYAYFIADSIISSYSILSLKAGEQIFIDKISTVIE